MNTEQAQEIVAWCTDYTAKGAGDEKAAVTAMNVPVTVAQQMIGREITDADVAEAKEILARSARLEQLRKDTTNFWATFNNTVIQTAIDDPRLPEPTWADFASEASKQ